MSVDKVVPLFSSSPEAAAITPQTVLEHASDQGLQTVVVVGLGEDDGLFVASSAGLAGDVVLLLECAKAAMVKQVMGKVAR